MPTDSAYATHPDRPVAVLLDDHRQRVVAICGTGDTYAHPGFWTRLTHGLQTWLHFHQPGPAREEADTLLRVASQLVEAEILTHWAPNGHGRVQGAAITVAALDPDQLHLRSIGGIEAWLLRGGTPRSLLTTHRLPTHPRIVTDLVTERPLNGTPKSPHQRLAPPRPARAPAPLHPPRHPIARPLQVVVVRLPHRARRRPAQPNRTGRPGRGGAGHPQLVPVLGST